MAKVFKLIEKTTYAVDAVFRGKKFTKQEDCYVYQANDGATLQFQAHPTVAFAWTYGEKSNEAGLHAAKAIITAFVKAGMDQHQFIGGFDEAVKTLTIK